MLKGKSGFTLAETLITLTILGVIATFVVPNIIKNYQKRMTITRLKMAYSMLDSLTQMSYIENKYPPIEASMSKSLFDTYFGKYLNIAKTCGMWNQTEGTMSDGGIFGKTGCFKQGTSSQGGNPYVNNKTGEAYVSDMFYDLDGGDNNQGGYGPSGYFMVLLKNGMSLGVSPNFATQNGYSILIDIDGPKKGDSKLGQDVFQFTYFAPVLGARNGNPNYYKNVNNCKNPGLLPGAWSPASMGASCTVTREYLKDRCKEHGINTSPFRNGSGCSGLIIKDGWKISSDYPWDYAHKKP